MAGERKRRRPHVLGIDDGPFVKGVSTTTPIVAVMMEGADLVEGIAVTEFPIDGDGITDFLCAWLRGGRFLPSLQAIVFGGVTIAGLAVVEIERLARELATPVLVVNRRDPTDHHMHRAFAAAGLEDRLKLVEAMPPARRLADGLYAASAGIDEARVGPLLATTVSKAGVPEPVRLAHLFARAIVTGESRGRA